MAKILESQFSNIQDGFVLKADDLRLDRSVIRVAVNDNQSQLYRLFFGEESNLVFNTFQDLDDFASPVDLSYAVVMDDETVSPVSTTLYQYQTTQWVLISGNYSLQGVVTGDILDVYLNKSEYDTELTATESVKYARNLGTDGASITYAVQLSKNAFLDQSVKTSDTPTFAGVITDGGNIDDSLAGKMSRDIQNGAFKESFNLIYDSGTSKMVLTNADGVSSFLTMQFNDGDSQLNVASCSCAPIFGSTTVPVKNYFYILQSAKVLVVSSSSFPSAEHIKVAEVIVLDETKTNSEGPLGNRNWNNHEKDVNNFIGSLNHIRARLRKLGAQWDSGIAGATSGEWVNDVSGTLYFTSTAGIVLQMHPQTFMAKDTSGTDDMHIVNDFTAPYVEIASFDEILEYSDGSSIGNDYFNVFVYGICNKGGEYTPIMVNVPSSGYNNVTDAQADLDSTLVTTVPTEFREIAFPIARLLLKKAGGTYSFIQSYDLREQKFGIGGTTGTGVLDGEFIDTTFELQNITDTSKVAKISAANIPALSTVTVSWPNVDLNLQDLIVATSDIVTIKEDILTLEKVVELTHDTDGDFYATVPNISWVSGLKFTLLFPNTLTDLTEPARVSLDGQAGTYKALKYDDTLNVVVVKHTQDLKADVNYDGTELFMKGEPLVSTVVTIDSLSYSTFGSLKPIKGQAQMNEVNGLMLNQEILYGDFRASTGWTNLVQWTIGSGVASYDASANGYMQTSIEIIAGQKYAVSLDVSNGGGASRLLFTDGTGTTLFDETTAYLTLDNGRFVAVYTASLTTSIVRVYSITSGGTFDLDNLMFIPIDNTPLYAHTATQIDNMGITYFENTKWIVDYEMQSIGVNGFNKLTLTEGYYVRESDGVLVALSTTGASDYIPVIGGEDYISSGYTEPGSNVDGAWYDINQVYISGASGILTGITAPSNARYIRFTTFLTEIDTTQLQQGTTSSVVADYNSPTNFKLNEFNGKSVGTDIRDKAYELNGVWYKKAYVESHILTAGDITNLVTGNVNNDIVQVYTTLFTNVTQIQDSASFDVEGFIPRTTQGYDSVEAIGTFSHYAPASARLELFVANNEYADLAAAQADLVGTVVYYLVEEIIETELLQDGSIIQENNTTLIQVNNFATEIDVEFAQNHKAQTAIHDDLIEGLKVNLDDLEEIAVSSTSIDNMLERTQAQYDALVLAGTTDPRTLYVIVG